MSTRQSTMLRILLIIFVFVAVKIQANSTTGITLNKSGSQTLLITDGMSRQKLPGKILQSSNSSILWQAENGVTCKITLRNNNKANEYHLEFTTTSTDVKRLNVELINKFNLSDSIVFWDGFEEHKLDAITVTAERNRLTETFPLACVYNNKKGVALGFTPDTITSELNCGLKKENDTVIIFYRTKVVVDNRRAQKLDFVNYNFIPEFGWKNAIQDYYGLYPSSFEPVSGIDERIYGIGGYYTSAHLQRKLQLHAARRTSMTWEWTYAPWCVAGNWYVDRADWKDDDLHFFRWWHGIRKDRKTTWQEFHDARVEEFEGGNKMAAMFFYILVKDIFQDIVAHYPDARSVNKEGRSGKSGLHSLPSNRDKTYGAFAYGSALSKYLENQLSLVVKNYEVSGFAFDMANLVLNNYNKAQLNYAIGRSFDEQGKIFTPDSVLPIPFAQYIHSLKRDGKQMGTYMNFALSNFVASTVFHADGVMFEGTPDSHYENILPLRLMSGKKPFTFWGHITADSNTGIKQENYSIPAVKEEIHSGIANLLLLKCLEYGATPMNWAVIYKNGTFFNKWIPLLVSLKKAGWNPVPAVKEKMAEKLWIGRFGVGINTIITISNPTRKTIDGRFTVINSYLGNEKYIFLPILPGKIEESVNDSGTHFSISIAPKEVVVLKAFELAGSDQVEISIDHNVNGNYTIQLKFDDEGSCIIKGKRDIFGDKIIGSIKSNINSTNIEITDDYFTISDIKEAQLALNLESKISLFSQEHEISNFFSINDSDVPNQLPIIVLPKNPSKQEKTIASMIDRYYPYVKASRDYNGRNWSQEPGFFDPKYVDIDKMEITSGNPQTNAKKIYVGKTSDFPELFGTLSSKEKQQLKLRQGGFIKLLNDKSLWIGGDDARKVFDAGQKYFSLLDWALDNTIHVDFKKPSRWSVNKIGSSFIDGANQKYLRIVGCPEAKNNGWIHNYYTIEREDSDKILTFNTILKCKNLKGKFQLGIREVDEKGEDVKYSLSDITEDTDWKDYSRTIKLSSKTKIIQFYFIGRNMAKESEVLIKTLDYSLSNKY